MSKFILGAAGAAIALTLSAAAQAGPVTVKVADIDAETAQGAALLKQRTDAAVRRYCSANSGRALSERTACREGVRLEISEKIAERQLAMKAGKATEVAVADQAAPSR
jgi:UrcA family protein